MPELEDKYYYFGENSITTNSINFIPFKYLKPYFEESVKTKEQFYKFIYNSKIKFSLTKNKYTIIYIK